MWKLRFGCILRDESIDGFVSVDGKVATCHGGVPAPSGRRAVERMARAAKSCISMASKPNRSTAEMHVATVAAKIEGKGMSSPDVNKEEKT